MQIGQKNNDMINVHDIVRKHHIVFLTLDALRYDVAQSAWRRGLLPNFASLLPASGWERRHTPGNFTFPAHQAFFSGFLPTPVAPGRHPRLFATRFEGSLTTVKNTYVFEQADIVSGLTACGYHTVCIGGVGFFNRKTALSRVLPDMFAESHWQESFGVTAPASTQNQFRFAAQRIHALAAKQLLFLFINVSAVHQPNYFYLPDCVSDGLDSHQAALQYIDSQLPILRDALACYGPYFSIICSDHGTAYGEQGFWGHRHNHEVVMHVPYIDYFQTIQ